MQYGNIWTNIPAALFKQLNIGYGQQLHISLYKNKTKIYEGNAPYVQTFSAVARGKELVYLNSLMQLSFALNQGSFAAKYKVGSGSEWSVEVRK